MSNHEIIFENSKSIIKEGVGFCQGLLYCGNQYTSNGGCACLNCDGFCGSFTGCPCPDCDFTLTYILYASGQMNCPKCKSILLRLNLFNRVNLFRKNLIDSITCDLCRKRYDEKFLPLLYCKNCDFDMCPNCAFSKINFEQLKKLEKININSGIGNGEGILYCGERYTLPGNCKCGNCDGTCGPTNGCPCPICDLILGYNIYINNNMTCGRCKNALLIKTTLIELQKINNKYESGFSCNHCQSNYKDIFCHIYHCFKCDSNICQKCTYNSIKNLILLYPSLPKINIINSEENKNEKKGEHKENNEEIDEEKDDNLKCSICLDNNKCMLFLPCKHVSCCEKCAENLNNCPLCRALIQSIEDVYY